MPSMREESSDRRHPCGRFSHAEHAKQLASLVRENEMGPLWRKSSASGFLCGFSGPNVQDRNSCVVKILHMSRSVASSELEFSYYIPRFWLAAVLQTCTTGTTLKIKTGVHIKLRRFLGAGSYETPVPVPESHQRT